MQRAYGRVILMLVTLMSACSQQDDDRSSAPQGRLPDDNVFSDQVRALEKAESVQQTLDAAAAKQREAIERQGRP